MNSSPMHPPLSHGRCTRVLILQPAKSRTTPVVCTLEELDLDLPEKKRRSYKALSYVWDSPVGKKEITCNNGSLLVTENCLTALQYLRLRKRPRTLWIDAICINQNSTEERNQQVKMVGDIYKSAREVLIWLGQGNEVLEQALRRIYRVASLFEFVWPFRHVKLFRKLLRPYLDFTDEHFRELNSLLHHQWWQRTWTLQEYLFATESRVVCGSTAIYLRFLVNGSTLCMEFPRTQDWYIDLSSVEQCLKLRKLYREITSPTMGKSVPKHFEWEDFLPFFGVELFINTQSRQASDPRDKIYAMHQILRDCEIQMPQPNYALTVAQVYEEATVSLIQNSKSLRILELQESAHQQVDLPSWVPDFNNVRRPVVLAWKFDFLQRYKKYVPIYHDGHLFIQGNIIGRLTTLAPRLQFENNKAFPCKEMYQWLYILRTDKALTEIVPFQVLQNTLLDTLNDNGSPITESLGRKLDFSLFFEVLKLTDESQAPEGESANQEAKKLLDKFASKRVPESQNWSYFMQCVLENNERQLFVTDTGQIGLTQADARIGDLVVLFPGATIPYLLRGDGDHHRFVGIIHGMYKYRRKTWRPIENFENFIMR